MLNTNRIVIAIAVEIQTIDGLGIQVGGIVGRDESAPLGAIIPGVAVIQAGIVIVVIAAVTDGIRVGDGGIGRAGSNGAVAHIYILPNLPPAVKKKPPRPVIGLGGDYI
jgi:hypothetical protein